MIAFLTSSPTGPLDHSRDVKGIDKMNDFREKLKEVWPEEAKCLMITASPAEFEKNDEMTDYFEHALRISGFSVTGMELWDDRTKEEPDLSKYDVIFLGGGHVPTQNAFFDKINLRNKMLMFDGVVVGISAGTMNSADVVYAQPELPGESESPAYKKFLTGLNLTKRMILPHYQMVKDYILDGKRLYEDITYQDSMGHEFLALPDGSYLVCEDGREEIYGEAWILRDGEIKKLKG